MLATSQQHRTQYVVDSAVCACMRAFSRRLHATARALYFCCCCSQICRCRRHLSDDTADDAACLRRDDLNISIEFDNLRVGEERASEVRARAKRESKGCGIGSQEAASKEKRV